MKAGEINLGGKAAGYAYISKNAVTLYHKSLSPITGCCCFVCHYHYLYKKNAVHWTR
jgi:hypothetical protein